MVEVLDEVRKAVGAGQILAWYGRGGVFTVLKLFDRLL
jgi:hypothetical protein